MNNRYGPIIGRMGLTLPAIAVGARVLESNFGRPSCSGRFCSGPGSTGYNEILFVLVGLGAIAAVRSIFVGPSRIAGAVGLFLALAAFLAPAFAFEIPALARLWP